MISGVSLQTAANQAAFASAHNQFQESLAAQRSQAANHSGGTSATAGTRQTASARDITVSHLSAAAGLQAEADARNNTGVVNESVTSALTGGQTYNYLGNVQPNHAGTGKIFSAVA